MAKTAMDYLGKTFEDKITGVKGVAVGYVVYISGCNQVLLTPRVDEKGDHRSSHWFDEQRLVLDSTVPLVALDNGQAPGFDTPAPVR